MRKERPRWSRGPPRSEVLKFGNDLHHIQYAADWKCPEFGYAIGVARKQRGHQRIGYLFQFSDRTRCSAMAAGLLALIQSRVRPGVDGRPLRHDAARVLMNPIHRHRRLLRRVASGRATAAPPSKVMNSRRFTRSPHRRGRAAFGALRDTRLGGLQSR